MAVAGFSSAGLSVFGSVRRVKALRPLRGAFSGLEARSQERQTQETRAHYTSRLAPPLSLFSPYELAIRTRTYNALRLVVAKRTKLPFSLFFRFPEEP